LSGSKTNAGDQNGLSVVIIEDFAKFLLGNHLGAGTEYGYVMI
jgi:hypothetical protein